jgi:hypothetical protein
MEESIRCGRWGQEHVGQRRTARWTNPACGNSLYDRAGVLGAALFIQGECNARTRTLGEIVWQKLYDRRLKNIYK